MQNIQFDRFTTVDASQRSCANICSPVHGLAGLCAGKAGVGIVDNQLEAKSSSPSLAYVCNRRKLP